MATAVADLELPQFDYMDPGMRGSRFHETIAELAGEGWLAGSELGWLFVVDREASQFFLRSKQVVFPAPTVADMFGITEGPLSDAIRKNLISIEGDAHRRLRNLVNPAFNSREADRLRPRMREHLAELWEPLAGSGECEFVAAFARWYPSRMIAELIGAGIEDAGALRDWAMWFQRQFDPAAISEQREEIEREVAAMRAFVDGLLERRRSDPADDLATTLLNATYEGDRLSDDEAANLIMNVIAGGIDTTESQLAQAIHLFCLHPDQWRMLATDPSLAPAAVEEVLRYEPVTPFTARMTAEAITYRDVEIPPGTVLMISTLAGNRDAATYSDPYEFDITADRGGARPMTFGAGIHNCLGANLARAELQEALIFLAPRMLEPRLVTEPTLGSVAGVYEVEQLRIAFEAGTPA